MIDFICSVALVGYMEIIDISFHTSKESATQEAIYIADTIYDKNFTSLEDIEKYQDYLYNGDMTEDIIIVNCKEVF